MSGLVSPERRNLIELVPLVDIPVKPRTQCKNSLKKWRHERDLALRTNEAIIGLGQMWSMKLDDALLNHTSLSKIVKASEAGRQLRENIWRRMRERPPPPDRVTAEAALSRLRKCESSASPALPCAKGKAGGGKPGTLRVPQRGEIWPATVADVALPPAGSSPIPIETVSPSARALFEDQGIKMLATEEERRQAQESLPKPFIDEGFRGKAALALAVRMAQARMLRGVRTKRGGLGLFTVVKSTRIIVHPDGRESLEVKLRLVFDQRFDNGSWKPPPWTGLCGPGSLAAADLSNWAESPASDFFEARGGDIPN